MEDAKLQNEQLNAQLKQMDVKGKLNPAIFIDAVTRGMQVQGLNPSDPAQASLLSEASKLAKINLIENKPVKNTITKLGNTVQDYMWDAGVQVGLFQPQGMHIPFTQPAPYAVTPNYGGGQGGESPAAAVQQGQPQPQQQDPRAKFNSEAKQLAMKLIEQNPKLSLEKALPEAAKQLRGSPQWAQFFQQAGAVR